MNCIIRQAIGNTDRSPPTTVLFIFRTGSLTHLERDRSSYQIHFLLLLLVLTVHKPGVRRDSYLEDPNKKDVRDFYHFPRLCQYLVIRVLVTSLFRRQVTDVPPFLNFVTSAKRVGHPHSHLSETLSFRLILTQEHPS